MKARSNVVRSESNEGPTLVRNRLLRQLPPDERARLLAVSDRVRLSPRQILHHFKLPMEHVYFLESGLVSVAAKIGSEKFVEVWLTGYEGMVGAPIVLTGDMETSHRRTVRVAGDAWRIKAADFLELVTEVPVLRTLIHRYLAVVLMQTSQSGACNSSHGLMERLARWLLLARRALDADEIPLTHGVLAQLLGVRRASITDCLRVLQQRGLIATNRGTIRIVDLDGLSAACCDCFRLIDREYDRQVLRFQRGFNIHSVDAEPASARPTATPQTTSVPYAVTHHG